MILMPSEHGMSAGSLCLKYVLTVLAGGVGRGGILVLVLVFMVFVVLYLFDDLIEKVVEKLVRVLVHEAAEVLVPVAKLVDKSTWCNGTLISWIRGNKDIEGSEGGEEGWGS